MQHEPVAQPTRTPAPPTDVLFEGLVDGLTVHDADGRYLYVSPSFAALTGHGSPSLIGSSPFDLELFHPDDVARIVEVQERALESLRPWRVPYRFRRADDAYLWLESVGRVVDASGSPRFVVSSREATHLESLVQGVAHEREVKQRLEELVARQQHFLTTVSHRARTPMTSVVGMAHVLKHTGDALDADRRATLVERLAANADRLAQLFEEVTEADRLSRADVVLQRRVVDVHDLVGEVVQSLTGGDRSVTVVVPTGLRAVIDRAKVARLLHILISNAFTHGGLGVAVTVRALRTDDGIELIVEDDGPGVPPPLRQHVFEAFRQGDADTADPGAGLGLYLAAELAALHRGRAWVDERPGGGARFHVSLPRPRADALSATPGTQDALPSASALTPEADRFVTRLLSTIRQHVGMDVVYLTLLDDEHQHVLAVAGEQSIAGIEPGTRIELDETYCARMVVGELANVVGDTHAEPRIADLPATRNGLRCWMGVPVHLPGGQVIGTLCCAGAEPRPDASPASADRLDTYATILGDQLALDGFLDRTVFDAAGRVADLLTRADALHPVYQPIVDLATGSVTGVEALARVRGDDRPVDLWFADAARSGLLVDLEILSIELALQVLPELPLGVSLSLNVSPVTLTSRELATVLDGHPLDRIVLEVTEHAAVDDYDHLTRALEPYRAGGARIAIDDVGTGFAGLGHLVRLHPDVIKIDRSMIETLDTDATRIAAVEGLARLAHHIGAQLVAEGIERAATLTAVREAGFTHAQGYLLGRPEPTVDHERSTGRARQVLAPRSAT